MYCFSTSRIYQVRSVGNHLPNIQAAAQEYVEIKYQLPDAKLIGPHVTSANIEALDWIEDWRDAVYSLTCGQNNPHPEVVLCGYPDVAG